MKKSLLLGTFAIFGLMANAQLTCEPTAESMEAAGFVSGEKVALAGGVVFGSGEAGTIATAYADDWGISAPCGGYKNVKVGNVELALSTGGVGNTNPTFTNYAGGVMSAGAVFAITPAADGWLTVFTKMNPNKQYVVFEGKSTGLAYHLGYSNGTENISYVLPYTEDYAIDFYAADAANYFVASGGEGAEDVKPQFPWMVQGLEASPSDNTAFLTFNVLGGLTYYFSALGSKAPCGAFVLTTTEEEPTVTFLATDELKEQTFGPMFVAGAGVETVNAVLDENAPVYNVMGQKVNDDYKGIVIKNGKKYIRR